MSVPASIIEVTIPQIGEGLQEARLVAVLKKPGDLVKRDEPIYQMETDKAVMDVESPYEGILVEWLATEDSVLPIGAAVARMQVAGAAPAAVEPNAHFDVMPAQGTGNVESGTGGSKAGDARGIPPRTRTYAQEKGLSPEDLVALVAQNPRPMPGDVDAFLAAKRGTPTPGKRAYADAAVAGKQRVLNSRMVRSNSLVVPGTMTVVVGWSAIEGERKRLKDAGGAFQPSAFTMFAYAVAKAMGEFPAFRTTLPNDDALRTYERASLGIAVARPGDELLLAVVEGADALDWTSFAASAREAIDQARGGKDQAHEAVTVSLTNMQAYGLRDAVPVVVAPSMATIFLGEAYWGLGEDGQPRRQANVGMTFDHRIANGVGAAEFLKAIRERVENVPASLNAGMLQ